MRKQSYFTKIRRYRLKKKAVELKGGKCKNCGWSGNIAAFHFHHRDPKQKEFILANSGTTKWETYWKEAEKCDLLCANCHGIFHSDYLDEGFLKDVDSYNGRDLDIYETDWKNNVFKPMDKHKICEFCKVEFMAKYNTRKFCCVLCKSKNERVCKRPTEIQLKWLLNEKTPMTKIGKMFGVSNNTAKKWCKQYNLI